ncbi:MAG TPA: FtsX-like permease family protein, partial [Gemmata sp.]|nr:FtsX-like permease family protein [Gemmata sp.]
MYRLLLCLRYLRTRYLAFICIISVMLGVATLIVVNSVMSGFATKLKDRLHGMLSDVIIETDRMDGFLFPNPQNPNGPPLTPEEIVQIIQASPAGEKIAAISPTIEVFAILQFDFQGQTLTKPVKVIGVDPKSRSAVGGFREYLERQSHSSEVNFELTPEAKKRHEMNLRALMPRNDLIVPNMPPKPLVQPLDAIPEPDSDAMKGGMPETKLYGAIPGFTIAHFRYRNEYGQVVEEAALKPGDRMDITTVSAFQTENGLSVKPVAGSFLVTDYLRTEMSEYDQSLVYVPLDHLQAIRGMQGRCTHFQIKLKDYQNDKEFVTRELQKIFPPQSGSRVATWEEMQGSLLAAIDVERSILNLLLFMIVGVAGFSILAIFTMIVSEKYRDIGILKSLGASNRGVMSIFVGYGLLLGVVGCLLGTTLGLWITENINGIEGFLTQVMGRPVFPRDVYYFKEIPTNIER